MKITTEKNGDTLIVRLSGRLDTTTAPELEQFLDGCGESALTLDFSDLSYISSAGLRVLLKTHKRLIRGGSMKLVGVCAEIQEIFDMTGFSDILTIE